MLTRPTRAGELARVLLLVLLFSASVFGIATRELWDRDEGMHAAMSREMVETGDWLTPRFNGEPFFDKPVLFTWLGAVSMRLLGFTELGARLPSALLGLGTILVIYAFGRRVFGLRAGLLGAATLATTGGLLLFSSVVVHDVCLTFFVTLCIALLHQAIEHERRRGTLVLLASAAAAGAFLSKGPVGVVLPAATTIVFLLLVRQPGLLLRMRLGWSLLVFLAVAAPWYVLLTREHPDYLRYFFIEQNLGYFASPQSAHPRPWWFLGPALVYLLMPWSFFLPAALISVRPDRSSPTGRAALLLLVWAAVTLLFFSAAESKLPGYILPLLPPLALLVGVAWDRLEDTSSSAVRRSFLAGGTLFFALTAGAALYLQLRPAVSVRERSTIDPADVGVAVGLLALVLGCMLALLFARRWRAAFASIALSVVGLFVAFTLHFAPKIDPFGSSKTIASLLERRLAPDEDFVVYGYLIGYGDSALYYTGRYAIELREADEIGAHLDSPERTFALASMRRVGKMGPHRERVWVVERVGNLMVVSNRPDAVGDSPGIREP